MAEDPQWVYFDRPAGVVESNISTMNSRAEEAITAANSVLDALASFKPPEGGRAPSFTGPGVQMPARRAVSAPGVESFGSVGPFVPPPFEELDVDLPGDSQIDETFTPSVTISLPSAPDAIDTSGLPEKPTTVAPVLPDAPVLVEPTMDALNEISIPAFTFPTLPTFSATAPVFTAAAPSPVVYFDEPVFADSLAAAVKAKVEEWLQGGTGLPAAVEQALFDRARSREQMVTNKRVDEAMSAFAARGFMLPNGALAAAVAEAQESGALRESDLSRQIYLQSAQWEIENLRFAVGNGITLTGQFMGLFQEAARRSFEVARLRLDAELRIYDAAVTLFNAQQNAYQVEANVFKTRLDGELAKLTAYRAQIDAQLAIGQLNEQLVKVYLARIEGLKASVSLYTARMDGAKTQADIARTQIEGFRAEVEAYSAKLQAQKVVWDGYEAQVRGEAAKGSIIEAESRAFGSVVQAQIGKQNVIIEKARTRIAATQASVQKYAALTDSQSKVVSAQMESVRARAAAYTAAMSKYEADLRASGLEYEVAARLVGEELRNALAYYEIQVKEYDAVQARALQASQLVAEALRAAGQMTSSLAQGAMSAIHVQAGMSGAAHISSSNDYRVVVSRKGADVA